MSKEGQYISAKYYVWVKEFGEAILSTDGTVILCKICDKQIKTWFNAAIYCSEHHSSLLTVFNAEDCASVATCRSLLSDSSLANELAFIDPNFKILL